MDKALKLIAVLSSIAVIAIAAVSLIRYFEDKKAKEDCDCNKKTTDENKVPATDAEADGIDEVDDEGSDIDTGGGEDTTTTASGTSEEVGY